MKVLHFYAAAAHPSMTLPLMGQSHQLLWPFQRYLQQAIHTAKQRQVRYQLPWERVRNVSVLALTPKDTCLRIARPAPGWLFTDWPTERAYDLAQPIMIVNRGVTVGVSSVTPTSRGLRVETAEPLRADDVVFWCGRPCAYAPEDGAVAPSVIRTLDGAELTVRGSIERDGDTYWRCVLEGVLAIDQLSADGCTVRAEVLSALDGARRLVDAAGHAFELSNGQLKVETLPAEGPLRADNGVRFAWRSQGKGARRGQWVQLLAPSDSVDAEALVDPRAAFCDGDVHEVWTQDLTGKALVAK